MRRGGFVARHRVGLASTVVVAAAVVSLVAYAFAAVGYPVHHARLNDGGVWVTGSNYGKFAELNKPVGQFDGGVWLGSQPDDQVNQTLDVLQDANAIFGWNKSTDTLAAIDGTTMGAVQGAAASVPDTADIALGGSGDDGVLAVLDTGSGKLWATHVSTDTQSAALKSVDRTAKPGAKLAAGSRIAVATDGTIYAASPNGALTAIAPAGSGFAKPHVTLTSAVTPRPTITTVGSTPVVLAGSRLYLDGSRSVTFAGIGTAVLQQPGAAGSQVVLETSTSVVGVDLQSGRSNIARVPSAAGTAIGPVQVGGCTYAAWVGQPSSYRTSCGPGATYVGNIAGPTITQLAFRVNREQVVLNDPVSGATWNVDGAHAVQVGDWTALAQQATKSGNSRNNPTEGQQNKPPVAHNATFRARPGTTSVLHVLDNATHASNDIIAITGPITGLSDKSVEVSVSPDEQTVAIRLPAGTTNPVGFDYTITGERSADHPSTAHVVVDPVPDGTPDTAPYQLDCADAQACAGNWTAGASSVIAIPVLDRWRDHESDTVTLLTATADDGVTPSVTPEGNVVVTAPPQPPAGGQLHVTYTVTDGYGGTAQGRLAVSVLPANSASGKPPTARTVVAQATVGQPVQLDPLDNDLPGADPTTQDPQLQLATVQQVPGAVINTDTQHGVVTFTGNSAKTFVVPYSITYGTQSAHGYMRIDVHANRNRQGVVAMPDSTILYGDQASVVDVLANDYSASGSVLVVDRASTTAQGLLVSVIGGHWLRIQSQTDAPVARPLTVDYSITDGTSVDTSQVTVQERPAVTADRPIALPDVADVRVGDAVTIPVLDNDIDPGGAPLSIQPGSVTRPVGGGSAFVTGNTVRYIAPPTSATATSATFSYAVTNGSQTATTTVAVRIHPLPRTVADDAQPEPLTITQGVVAGGTVTIHIPTSGVDPDGDSVILSGIANPGPTRGAVTGMTASTLTYEAFPQTSGNQPNAGTDVVGYQVEDRFGKVGTGQIRFGIVPPLAVQPPVAVNDTARGWPGDHLAINVVANDVVAPGDTARVTVLGSTHAQVDRKNPQAIDVTAPPVGAPLVVHYQLVDGAGQSNTASLIVKGVAGWDNPPVAQDDNARPDSPNATAVTVPVLRNDSDPDRGDTLHLVGVYPQAHATVVGNEVRVSLIDQPQVLNYEVSDGHLTTAAAIFAPALHAGAPYVKTGTLLKVPAGKGTTLDINSFLVDPSGASLTTTYAQYQTATAGLQLAARGPTLTMTGVRGYVGLASITLQVRAVNAKTGTEGSFVTVPVQIGSPTPVLTCPPGYSGGTLYQGGNPITLDIPTICHVWLPQGGSLSQVKFSKQWGRALAGVGTNFGSTSRTLTLTPSKSTKPAQAGTVLVRVAGGAEQTIGFQVATAAAKAAPLTLHIDPQTAQSGTSLVVAIDQYAHSPLPSPQFQVLKCARTSGTGVSCSPHGGSVTVQPSATARGLSTFAVTLTDKPGDASRSITATMTVSVIGPPDAPASVIASTNYDIGGEATLTWPAPANTGGVNVQISYYLVTYSGGPPAGVHCGGNGCHITGLTDGQSYVFHVRSVNDAGKMSPAPGTASNAILIDAVPGVVQNLAIDPASIGDGTVRITWSPPSTLGSGIQQYLITVTDETGGGTRADSSTSTAYVASGLDNTHKYAFTVAARNKTKTGPYSPSVEAETAGVPDAPTGVTTPPEALTQPSSKTSVAITWNDVTNPNGGPIGTYTVYRRVSGNGTGQVVCTVSNPDQTSGTQHCSDDVPNDGTHYQYAVTATNTTIPPGHGKESAPSAWSDFVASGIPDQIKDLAVFASQGAYGSGAPDPGPNGGTGAGFDGALKVRFTPPAANGGGIDHYDYSINGGGNWSTLPASDEIGGLTNGQGYSVEVRAVNTEGHDGVPSSPASAEYPFGPPNVPQVSATNSGNSVTYSWSDTTNGRPIANFYVSIDGNPPQQMAGANGSVTYDRGYQYTYSINAYVKDSAGNQSTTSATQSGTTPNVPPPGGVSCSASGKTISCSWGSAGAGLTYNYQWDGGATTNTAATSASQQFDYNQTHTITVIAVDGKGHQSSAVSGQASTPPPPQFQVQHEGPGSCNFTGDSAYPGCEYVEVRLIGFPPGGTATCSATGLDAKGWGPYTLTAGSDGTSGWINHYLFDSNGSRYADGSFDLGYDNNGLSCH